jgi:hypothetical protein
VDSAVSVATAKFSSAGQGYFWGGIGSDMPITALNSSAQAIVASNNQIAVWQFIIPFSITVRNVAMRIVTANSGKLCACAVYDLSGNRLIDSGNFSQTTGSTTLNNALGTPITLNPGAYYFAFSQDSTVASVAASVSIGTTVGMFAKSLTTRIATAANSWSNSTGFPSTLGALSSATGAVIPIAFFAG